MFAAQFRSSFRRLPNGHARDGPIRKISRDACARAILGLSGLEVAFGAKGKAFRSARISIDRLTVDREGGNARDVAVARKPKRRNTSGRFAIRTGHALIR